MTRIQHAGGAVSATLSSSITNSDATIACDNLAGWPDGSVGPFYAVINRGKPTEEKIRAAGRSTNTLTGVLRGQDGTTASAHSSAETIDHIFTALEADAANAHIEATTGVHGTTGALVGATQTQTLTNKTLTSPIINSGTITGATLSGTTTNSGTITGGTISSATLSSATLSSPTINTPTLNGSGGALTLPAGPDTLVGRGTTDTLTNKTLTSPVINAATFGGTSSHTGLMNNSGTITGGTVNPTTLQQGGVQAVTVSGTQTLTNKTLNGATLDAASTIGGVSGTSLADDRAAWTSYTPTATNLTNSLSSSKFYYKRVGNRGYVRGDFASNTTVGAGTFSFTLPSGWTLAANGSQGFAVPFGSSAGFFQGSPSGSTLTSSLSFSAGTQIGPCYFAAVLELS